MYLKLQKLRNIHCIAVFILTIANQFSIISAFHWCWYLNDQAYLFLAFGIYEKVIIINWKIMHIVRLNQKLKANLFISIYYVRDCVCCPIRLWGVYHWYDRPFSRLIVDRLMLQIRTNISLAWLRSPVSQWRLYWKVFCQILLPTRNRLW